jgi:[acyl-carrier-protein] S-malonyltransferase
VARSVEVLLFPGQGGQHAEMRDRVQRWRPDLLERAQELIGCDPFTRMEDGTHYVHPAVFCASLAGLTGLVETGVISDVVAAAGHSLGELAALAAAGVMSEEDALHAVLLRGRLTHALAQREPLGGMMAIMGAALAELAPVVEAHGLSVAGDNSPRQVVVAGPVSALESFSRSAVAQRLECRRLNVEGAFHSPAMAEAVPEYRAALEAITMRPPRWLVVSSVTGSELALPEIPHRLAEGLTEPVRWRAVLATLYDRGLRSFVEVGPGSALTGLARRTLSQVRARSVDALELRTNRSKAGTKVESAHV